VSVFSGFKSILQLKIEVFWDATTNTVALVSTLFCSRQCWQTSE